MSDTQEYPPSPPRTQLKPFEGKRLHFTGTVEKYSELQPCYGRPYYTACVQSIRCRKHDISFDHVWIRIMPHQLKHVKEGKYLCFSGEIREYLRGYHKMQFTHEWIDWSTDYGIVDVRIILQKPRRGKNDVVLKKKINNNKGRHSPLVKPKWMKNDAAIY